MENKVIDKEYVDKNYIKKLDSQQNVILKAHIYIIK